MKNTRLSLLIVGACTLFPLLAHSLGLGDISTQSEMNEPFIAEIPLTNTGDLESSQVIVAIGSDSDYELAGVTREFFHSNLTFEVLIDEVATPKIIVRSQGLVVDPYLNFIVQVRWPQGRLLREYTVLLDVPVFSAQPSGPVAAPANSAAPRTAREAVSSRATQQGTSQQSGTSPSQGSTFRSGVQEGGQYSVSSGDTLWAIARQVEQSTGISVHQAMIAIHEENKEAFVDGDINRLKSDAILRVPSRANMLSITEGQAARDFLALNQEASATPIQATATDFRNDGAAGQSGLSGRLALASNDSVDVAPNDGNGGAESVNGQIAADQAVSEALAENDALKEQLDAAEYENRDLQDRIYNLEEQIELLQEARALEIENSELSTVQDALDDESEQQAAPAPVSQPETLIQKLNRFRYWILGGLGLVFATGLMIALLVLRGRKSDEAEDLYFDEKPEPVAVSEPQNQEPEEELEEELEDELEDEPEKELEDELEEELEDELNEELDPTEDLEGGIDELTASVAGFDEGVIESEVEGAIDTESSMDASSDEVDSGESGIDESNLSEFEDLDAFFSDTSPAASNVLFGAEDTDEQGAGEEDVEGGQAVASDQDLEQSLEFSSPDMDDVSESLSDADALVQSEDTDENSLDFELDDMTSEAVEDADIDLEDKFDYTELDVTKDLGTDAETEFEESIEIHSTDMSELLVPPQSGLDSAEDQLFMGESPDVSGGTEEGAEALFEEVDDEVGSLLEEDGDDAVSPDGSILEADTDMDADLSDLGDLEDEGDLGGLGEASDLGDLNDDAGDLDDLDDLGDLGDLDDLGDLGDIDDTDLGMDDADEEFLTKLELAEAYIEMGDVQGARELLSEVEKDGNAEQKAAAQSLLEGIKT